MCSVTLMTTRDWRPRYQQVAEELRDQIQNGDLGPGDPLPSEPALAKTYDLSRTSVRNAIQQLKEWGLVRSERGRGNYVQPRRQRFVRAQPGLYQFEKDRVHLPDEERALDGFTEQQTRDAGAERKMSDLHLPAEYVAVEANDDLAEVFGVAVGTQMLERRYSSRTKDETAPLSIARSWLVYDVAAKNPALLEQDREPWAGGTQHQLFTVGIEVDRIEDRIIARAPTAEEALRLEVDPGTPVILIRKITFSTDGDVVEMADIVLPSDRAELRYSTSLERWT